MTRLLLLFTMLFLFSLSGVYADDWQTYLDGNYQGLYVERYGGNAPSGSYEQGFGLYNYTTDSSNLIKDTRGIGSNNQVLVSDLDNDGIAEMIVTDADSIYIFNEFQGNLVQRSRYIVTGTDYSITPAIFNDSDANGLKEIIGVWNETMHVFEYNGSKTFNKITLISKLDLFGRRPSGEMFCDTLQFYDSEDAYCFIPTQDGWIQATRFTSPFIRTAYTMSDEPESDGVSDIGSNLWLGVTTGGVMSELEFILRGHWSGNVNSIDIQISNITADPFNASLIYDIFICRYDETGFASEPVGSNCMGGEVLIGDDINISDIFGHTTGMKTINVDSFYMERGINYTLRFEGVNAVTPSVNSYYVIAADNNPTTILSKRVIIGSVLYTVIPAINLSGTSVLDLWDENDITPSSSQALNTYSNAPPIMLRDSNDGRFKLLLIHDNNNNNDEGLALIDIDTLAFETTFNSGSGFADDMGGSIFGIAATNIQNPDGDFVVHWELSSLRQTWIGAYDMQFGLIGVDIVMPSCSANVRGSAPFSWGGGVSCGVGYCIDSANSYTSIQCFNFDKGIHFIDHESPRGSTWDSEYIGIPTLNAFGAAMTLSEKDWGVRQIVLQRGIFYFNYSGEPPYDLIRFSTIAPMTNGGTPNNRHTLTLADVNGDGALDILGIRTGGISGDEFFMSIGNVMNRPPELINPIGYAGFGSEFGLVMPRVCVNDSITFSARERLDSQDGNYDNDIFSDTERLVTNCGLQTDYLEGLMFGSYSQSSPQITCDYDTVGTYNVRLYIQDSANEDVFSQYNPTSIQVEVVKGEPPYCSNHAQATTPTSTTPSAAKNPAVAADELRNTIDILTGADPMIKMIGAIIIIFACIVTLLSWSQTAATAMVGLVIGTILSMVLGLISVWLVILFILTMLGLTIFGKFLFKSNDAGG